MLAAELTHQLKSGNHHGYGTGPRTVSTPNGELNLDIPRDRQATFEPQLVARVELPRWYSLRTTRTLRLIEAWFCHGVQPHGKVFGFAGTHAPSQLNILHRRYDLSICLRGERTERR